MQAARTFSCIAVGILMSSRVSGFLFGGTPLSSQRVMSRTNELPSVTASLQDDSQGLGSFTGKMSSPKSSKRPWRPAGLPKLTAEDLSTLSQNLPVESQHRNGNSGGGYVVLDIKGTPEAVWSLLTDYARYDQLIGTVRRASVKPGSTRQCARATFLLSKFLLEVSVLHLFNSERQHLSFTLDPASTNVVLKEAEGLWFVESEAVGLRPGHVRVWFGASVRVSRMVPGAIIKYASSRALRRGTSWLREAVAQAPLTLAAEEAKRRTITGDADMPGATPPVPSLSAGDSAPAGA